MTTSVDQRGRAMAASSPTREIVPSTNALYGQQTIQPFDPGLFIYHTRDPLITFKGFRTIEKMLEDPQVAASLGLLRFSVLAGGYTVSPSDANDPEAVEIAKFVEYTLGEMTGTLEDSAWRILDALPRGFSLAEKVWTIYQDGPYKGKMGIKTIKGKKPGAWRFDLDEFDNVLGIQSLNPGTSYGAVFPPEKFIRFAWSPEYENPYGQSILRAAYRHWWAKDATIKFWNVFNDKFGAPTVTGKYQPGESQDVINAVLKNLTAFQTDAAIAYPNDWEVALLEVTRSGQSAYEAAVRYHDEQIALAITNQSLATNQHSKGGGSKAQGQVHQDALLVNEGMVKLRLEDVLNEQLIRPTVDYNFANASGKYPRLMFADLKPEDTQAIAEVLAEMIDRGVVGNGEEWVRERLKFPADERTPEERAIDLKTIKGQPPQEPQDPAAELDDQVDPPEPPQPPKVGKGDPAERHDHAGQFGRPLLKFEKRMNFERIEGDQDALEGAFVSDVSKTLSDARRKVIEHVKAEKLFGARGNLEPIKRLELPGGGDLRKALRTALDMGFEAGLTEGDATVEKLRESTPEPIAVITGEDWRPRPVRELAEDYLAQKPDLIGLEIEEAITREVRSVLVQAIRGDWSESETIHAVSEAFDKWVDEAGLGDAGMSRAANLKAIARTNLNDAYNQGLRSSFESPPNRGFVTALMYSSVMDSRTTPFCRAWDGVIRPIGDPIWNRVTPPNHYGERAIIVPLTRDDDYQITENLPSIKPQRGF